MIVIAAPAAVEAVPAAIDCVLTVAVVPLTVGVPVGEATAIAVVALETNDTVFVAFAVTVHVPLSSVVVASARPAIVIFVPTGKAVPAPVAVTVAVAELAVRDAAVTAACHVTCAR